MAAPSTNLQDIGKAEAAFREAFARLCAGKPTVLPSGAKVTQNNVAKEAGRDPSALKKSRYPTLIQDIQSWVEGQAYRAAAAPSPRQSAQAARNRSRQLRGRIDELKRDRDLAQSLLVSAQRVIVDLTKEVQSLRAAESSNIAPLASARTPPLATLTASNKPKGRR